MKRLREKWASGRGASILLALLLMLVCVMVAASVLMAAMSNAGKARGSREEQQKYLTLSSAMTLVCDQLAQSEYRGRYTYSKQEIMKTIEHSDGSTSQVHDYWQHTYEQQPGEFQCGLNGSVAAEIVLPLANDLDHSFAQGFQKSDSADHRYTCKKLDGTAVTPKAPYILELTAAGGGSTPWLEEPVTVTVSWNSSSGHLSLRAELKDGEESAGGHTYAMEAELTADKAPGAVLKLGDDPEAVRPEYETQPITWTLNWITRQ